MIWINDMEEQWLDRGACPNPECGSSDANVNHSEGYSFCYSCWTRFGEKGNKMETENIIPMKTDNKIKTFGTLGALTERSISKETAQKYNTDVIVKGNQNTHHIYKYFDEGGNNIANKIRNVADKEAMRSEGKMSNTVLFGQNIFAPNGKYITITEGEVDAMSAFELLGSKWACVSVKNGAHSALGNCKKEFEYLDSFDQIVISFDMDKQGRDASEKVAQLFSPNKCKIMHMEHKDANEFLQLNKREEFTRAWWNAQPYTPAGIVNLKDLGDALYTEEYCETCLYPWHKLNHKTYGMRTGELVTFTSGAGMGKSSVMRELMYHLLKNTEDNVGIIALEEGIKNTTFNIMSVEANARLYIKEVREKFEQEQLNTWQENTVGTGRFFAFDHFGSMDNDEILSRIRYMAQALDCKWIFLDHLSILVSGQEDTDERKSIDILMTKLRSLVEQTNIGLLLVSHLRRPSGDRGHEDGREVSLSHLRGSASIAHLSDSVIALERDQQSEDDVLANTTTVRVLKNRYTGDTGVATHLFYDKDTGRMKEISNPYEVEDTSTIIDEEIPF
jgi:twinkle protein